MIETRRPQDTHTNGHADVDGEAPITKPYSLRRWTMPAIALSLIPVLLFGAIWVIEQIGYVQTDNAQVSGTVAQLGHTSAGQVRTVAVDVGDEVVRNQLLATVVAGGQNFSIRSPFDGVVAARYAAPGDAVTAGRSVVAVLDTGDLWIEARVEEWQGSRIRAGATADVYVDALGQTIKGRVLSVGSASVGSLGGQPGQTFSAGRPRQLVPVRIEIDQDLPYLVYGGLASVKIHVR